MLKKTLLSTAAAASVMLAGAPLASADDAWSTSANVALTTDYKFRGISQSDESAAIQGGFDVSHESGFYIGTWGSSVDFDSNDGYDGSLELDIYAGFGGSINDDWSYDVGGLYYAYPGDDGDDGDFFEVYGSISWKDLTAGVNYSDDYYAETDEATYIYADYSYGGLPWELTLDLHVGYQFLEEDGGFLSSDEDGYTDYSVSISRDFAGYSFAVAYTGTDLDDDDLFGTDWGDGAVIGTISASF